jgi:phage FluMu gp28-like protein
MARGKHFLPYQINYLNDHSRLKLWRKTRRGGMTYTQAYEDVRDAGRKKNPMDVWFSSTDMTAGREYIDYCTYWSKAADIAATDMGEVLIDKEKDITAHCVRFASGKKIHALSSNPNAFRSKGGKLVWDEAAHHEDGDAFWKAASPIVFWGFPVRVLSSEGDQTCRFFRLAKIAENDPKWGYHKTTIFDAVRQGLADKIAGRPLTDAERADFIEECRSLAGDEDSFQQEYNCVAAESMDKYIQWDDILPCQNKLAGVPELYMGGPCFVGMDLARRRHLTVIWVYELVGDILWLREIIRLKNAPFAVQDAALDEVFERFRVAACCIDQTGMGEKFVEDAITRHGSYRVRGVLFNAQSKAYLARLVKSYLEKRRVRFSECKDIAAAHRAIRKVVTPTGNILFTSPQIGDSHADEFWAHAMALDAAQVGGDISGVNFKEAMAAMRGIRQ